MFDSDPNPYLEIGRVLFSINILFKTVIVCPGLDSNPVFIDGQTLILFFVYGRIRIRVSSTRIRNPELSPFYTRRSYVITITNYN